MDHVLDRPGDDVGPRALHPIFFGSFDWHSCVHGYWTLATLRRLHPEMPEAAAIDDLFAGAFTPDKVEAERAYLDRPSSRGFERPYGWAWLLMLQAELIRHDDQVWARRLAPLAEAFAERFKQLPAQGHLSGANWRPQFHGLRPGAGGTTPAARTRCWPSGLLRDTAIGWYGGDRRLPGLGAERRRLPVADPDGGRGHAAAAGAVTNSAPGSPASCRTPPRGQPATLFTPATVSDRSDGKIAHLDGLNLSRAWCWRAIASASIRTITCARWRCGGRPTHLAASPAPRGRRLYGRALAGQLRPAGPAPSSRSIPSTP
jgi:hypothetical protein